MIDAALIGIGGSLESVIKVATLCQIRLVADVLQPSHRSPRPPSPKHPLVQLDQQLQELGDEELPPAGGAE